MTKLDLEFVIPRKQILNANMALHHMQKAKRAAWLRKTATEAGLAWREHRQGELDSKRARERFDYMERVRAERLLAKKYGREVDIESLGDEPAATYVFNHFKVVLTVCPPTRTRIDPPNLYPTLKPIVDGLTDASFWEDDNYHFMLETSFLYGGLSGVKDNYRLLLRCEEVDDISHYITHVESH